MNIIRIKKSKNQNVENTGETGGNNYNTGNINMLKNIEIQKMKLY